MQIDAERDAEIDAEMYHLEDTIEQSPVVNDVCRADSSLMFNALSAKVIRIDIHGRTQGISVVCVERSRCSSSPNFVGTTHTQTLIQVKI